MPNLPLLARCVPNDFRNYKLYTSEVENVYRKHDHSLRVCYKHYSGQDYDGYFSSGDALSLDEFVKMLSEARMLDNCLTRTQAAYVL